MKSRLIHITFVAATAMILSGCQQSVSINYTDPDDPYIGWYKIQTRQDTIIPVFKIGNTYYSVCRGVEIPFRETPEGLEWASEASSMVGTTIGVKDSMPFIIIRDQQAEAVIGETSETVFQYGKIQFLTRIEKPSWLQSSTAFPPRSSDDFVGCFEPVWFPYYRLEIRKDGKKYLFTYLELDKDKKWKPQGGTTELKPLSDPLGFAGFFGNYENILTYNNTLHRFEMMKPDMAPVIRMPLVRISHPCTAGSTTPLVHDPVGIPSWH
jgi:hypothetical protein